MTVGNHLANLIRIPSVSSISNRPLIEYAQSFLNTLHWTTALFPYSDWAGVEKLNLIAAPPGQDVHAVAVDLAFLCHTDTVPPAAGWAEALDPFVRDGLLHGCGACDVKGFLACLLSAAAEVGSTASEVRIVLSADEEIGCMGARQLLTQTELKPKWLVVGEPTSLHPARAGKGYCLAEIIVSGSEAHSAHPSRGHSAIYAAARLILAVERLALDLEPSGNPFFDPPHTTINIGTIRGGTAKNIVPGECRFQVEWRPIPGDASDTVAAGIASICRRMCDGDTGIYAEFKLTRQQNGFETPSASPLVQAMETLTGRQPIAIPFGSEASVFAGTAEQTIVFGPGDMRTAHSPRECVPVAELEEAVACIKSLVEVCLR